jgi:guanyl-specific ribonuclease Sa
MAATLSLLLFSSPAVAADLEGVARTHTADTSIIQAPNCIPGGCDDLPPACTIPQEHCEAALYVHDFALSHNYSPPPGYRGGGVYRNTTNKLPPGGDYLEYRIYKTPASAERIVIDRNTNDTWFTGDHYVSFQELKRIILA